MSNSNPTTWTPEVARRVKECLETGVISLRENSVKVQERILTDPRLGFLANVVPQFRRKFGSVKRQFESERLQRPQQQGTTTVRLFHLSFKTKAEELN